VQKRVPARVAAQSPEAQSVLVAQGSR
jgi:hypothetical protein